MPEPSGLSPNTFQMLRELIHERTGLYFEDDKEYLLVDKLRSLVAARGIDSFLDYYYLLKYGEAVEEEWRRVSSALAVNESYFWREYDQVRAAVEVIVPQWQRARPGETVRIWTAACASGEEPYTLAMALEEAGCYLRGPIEILGTDFNEEALSQARQGIYRMRSFRSIPQAVLAKYFCPTGNDRYQIDEIIRSRVQFKYLNLVDENTMQRQADFHIIFCRNVFIYFSAAAIRRVLAHFHRALLEPGYLFVAAAESLLRVTNLFELAEVGNAFVYRKLPEQ